MPSLRKRHRDEHESSGAANGPQMAPNESGVPREPSPPASSAVTEAADSAPPSPPADDAHEALRARLAALERAEQAQREHNEQVLAQIRSHMTPRNEAPPQPEPVQFTERDHDFAAERGLQLDDPRLLRVAMDVQATGAMWPSDSFYAEMERRLPLPQQRDDGLRLDNELPPLREEAPAREPPPQRKPAPLAAEPEDSKPERPVASPEERRRASMVSAPVSREVPSVRSGRPDSGSRVTLTPTELEIAKASGLTEVQYATQKLRLQREKANDPERFRER